MPQIAGRQQPWRSEIASHLKGRSAQLEDLAVELLARGLSVRDIKDAFRDTAGRLLLSRPVAFQNGGVGAGRAAIGRLPGVPQARDLGEFQVAYLFVDWITERIRPGQRREPVLAAWAFTMEGKKVLLSMMASSKEDAETVSAFFQDMPGRGLGDPLLVTSDGAPGIIKAIETCFPRSARQRCLAHCMRNLAAKVPEEIWPDFKARAQAAYQAPSRAIARELAEGLVEDHEAEPPSQPQNRAAPRNYPAVLGLDRFELCRAHKLTQWVIEKSDALCFPGKRLGCIARESLSLSLGVLRGL